VTLPDKEWIDFFGFWASVVTLVGLPLGMAAVWYAARQLSLGRKAASAGVTIPLNDAFRERWSAFFAAETDKERKYQFAELANALEIACAISRDKVLYGASKDVLEHYLVGAFQVIESSADATQLLGQLLETPKTFENIVHFLGKHKSDLLIARTFAAKAIAP
jgi:hypothetical protein